MARRTPRKVQIPNIPSGVPNLDLILGGGIPVSSVNMVVGAPGSGKTTLAHQIIFHVASPKGRAIYFAAMGEPILKMLRYQQQFDFFDSRKVEKSVIYQDISRLAREGGLERTLQAIVEAVEAFQPAVIVIDSIRGLKDVGESRDENVRAFISELSSVLGAWSITSFLLGEYTAADIEILPEFAAADGIIRLSQEASGNASIRKIQAVKMRGRSPLAGRHSFRVDSSGISVFPRMIPIGERPELPLERPRLGFGVPGLDEMMQGGVPAAESLLIAGSSGTGKTLLALHFIAEGVKHNEPGVLITFEEHPREHERKARAFGWDLADWEKKGLMETIYLRPLDLSVDEVLSRVHSTTTRLKARRVAINSVSGFELGISPADEPDFREALFRLITTLSGEGVTVLMTTETPIVFGEISISPRHLSFLADNVVVLRYAEIESQLRRMIMVVKMRTSDHDKNLRQFIIDRRGVVVEAPFTEYSGVLSGIPTLRAIREPQAFTAGLTEQEEDISHLLLALGGATLRQVADGMSLEDASVQKMLDKLVDTGYVVKARSGPRSEPVYRVALLSPVGARRRK